MVGRRRPLSARDVLETARAKFVVFLDSLRGLFASRIRSSRKTCAHTHTQPPTWHIHINEHKCTY